MNGLLVVSFMIKEKKEISSGLGNRRLNSPEGPFLLAIVADSDTGDRVELIESTVEDEARSVS